MSGAVVVDRAPTPDVGACPEAAGGGRPGSVDGSGAGVPIVGESPIVVVDPGRVAAVRVDGGVEPCVVQATSAATRTAASAPASRRVMKRGRNGIFVAAYAGGDGMTQSGYGDN